MAKLKKIKFVLFGFVGFFGLLGFRYFFSGNPEDLFYFGFFAFFASWILGGATEEFQDERWRSNYYKAGTAAFWVAIAFVFLIGLLSAWSLLTRELVIAGCALGWVASLFTFAIAFRKYERQ